ncbi:MAG TPA: ATP-binding protein [Novosphingobium sp.]|nr:ATP-binding protein [Novosphingobium sp.]
MSARGPFPAPLDPAAHFRLLVFEAVLHLADERHAELPFVAAYRAEAARLAGMTTPPRALEWGAALDAATQGAALPFPRLARSGFGALGCRLLASVAMVEEDPALALLIEAEGGFPTIGGLVAQWRDGPDGDRAQAVRDLLLDLEAAGLVEAVDPAAMRMERRLRVPGPVLDVLSGAPPRLEAMRFEPSASLPSAAEWIAPRAAAIAPDRLGALLRSDPARLVLVRGPGSNGRRMLLGAAAREAGLGVLHVSPAALADPAQWRMAGALAHLSGAMLVGEAVPAPGETVTLPPQRLFAGPIGIAIGTSGGVRCEGALPVLAIDLPLPDLAARTRQWQGSGAGALADDLATMTMTLGNVARAARGAAAIAELSDRAGKPTRADVRVAARALRDARLDALATPVDHERTPEPLFLDAREQGEFDALMLRARHRERLGSDLGHGRGVRALFAGPSGTGKTLAARHVADRLGKDLYRIDLAATVSKYIGETEKCLERALGAAEELDVVLLLDEGDALMARRTDIGSSNDRYANLETNFLLQRIESFEGVILVTSNDAERIDPAFARRLDAVLTFRPPDAVMRSEILASQLGDHAVSAAMLDDIACRCALTGGQLRNVALHARLLAMDGGGEPDDRTLRAAIEREYRKAGAFSPLKPALAATG